jgi:WD repeat-containing protein 23
MCWLCVGCVLAENIDRKIRLYSTEVSTRSTWQPFKTIDGRDIGWSVIDTDYSPDQRWLIYSSWSNSVHMCNIYGDYEIHEAFDFE